MWLSQTQTIVRISLDYYRILGVPIQVTPEQIAQAYQDKSKQLPRREYSEQAAFARLKILDQVYDCLKDPLKRSEYDRQFFSFLNDQDSTEQGNILRSLPCIEIPDEDLIGALIILQESGEYIQLIQLGEDFFQGDGNDQHNDVCTSVALAQLELSREQWQQQNYELASMHGQKALDLLRDRQSLPAMQKEIENELAKLAPYRILKIFNQEPEPSQEERERGISLLQKILELREGLEGQGADGTGLDLTSFLGFIQQLRPLLSTQEQNRIFSNEDRGVSSAGLYLLVYTLIAQGFSQQKPELIAQAALKLDRISLKQDVAVEKSICSLLLGKTESALEQIRQSRDQDVYGMLLQHSANERDLLPGLCWYTEHWFKSEIVPHFRDLLDQSVSLDSYFDNQEVQKYIEQRVEVSTDAISLPNITSPQVNLSQLSKESPYNLKDALLSPVRYQRDEDDVPKFTTRLDPFGTNRISLSLDASPGLAQRRTRRKKIVISPNRLLSSLLLMGLGFGVFLLALHFIIRAFHKNPTVTPALENTIPGLAGEQLAIDLTKPTIQEPENEELSVESAKTILGSWLRIKAEALGPSHRIGELDKILAQPILERWQQNAKDLKAQGDYLTFEHEVQVDSVKILSASKAQVRAHIKETSKYYQGNITNNNDITKDNLVFQYDLTKDHDNWLISNTTIVK